MAVRKEKQLEVSTAMSSTNITIEGKSSARSDEEETILYSDDESMDIENICPKPSDDIESDEDDDDDDVDAGDDDDEDNVDDDGFHGDEDDDDDDRSDCLIAVKTEMETTLQSGVSVSKELKRKKVIIEDEPWCLLWATPAIGLCGEISLKSRASPDFCVPLVSCKEIYSKSRASPDFGLNSILLISSYE